MVQKRKQRSIGRRVFLGINAVIMLFVVAVTLFPFLYMFATSFSSTEAIVKTNTGSGTAQQLALNGKLLAYSDYFDKMPNFQAFMKQNNIQEELDGNRLSDGKLYEMPQDVNAIKYSSEQWFVRKDVFDSLGLSLPKTWEELYQDCLKIKQKYPDAYPIQNEFGTGNFYNMVAPSFGTQAGWGAGPSNFMYDDSSKKWVFAPATNNYKSFVTFLHKLYDEGILDKEFSTMDSSVTEQNCETNKGFIAPAWFGSESTWNAVGKKTDSNMNWVPVAPFAGPDGTAALIAPSQCSSWMVSPASVKDKPYFDVLLKWIDWMYKPEGGGNLFSWGVKGTTYETKDGKNQFLKGVYSGDGNELSKKYGVENNSLSFIYPKDFLEATLSKSARSLVDSELKNNNFAKRQPKLSLTTDDKDTESLYSTALSDYVSQMTDEFIMGKTPLSQWDAFVSQCKTKGADKLANLYNEVYTREKS